MGQRINLNVATLVFVIVSLAHTVHIIGYQIFAFFSARQFTTTIRTPAALGLFGC